MIVKGPDSQDIDRRLSELRAVGYCVAMLSGVFLAIGFAAAIRSQADGTCGLVIQDRINPNTACQASLVRLPGVGTTRAGAIIEYRQKSSARVVAGNECRQKDAARPRAFNTAEDLQNIKGIGPKTAQGVKPYLCFD